MRFGVKDLLLTTVLVSCYCAMAAFGLFGTREGWRLIYLPGCLMVAITAAIAWPINYLAGISLNHSGMAGRPLYRLAVRMPWSGHFLIALLAALMGLGYRFLVDSESKTLTFTSLLPFNILQGYLPFYLVGAKLHERGVVAFGRLRPFSELPFRLSSRDGQNRLSIRGAWWSPYYLVPAEHLEPTRELLALHRGADEAPSPETAEDG